MESKMNVITIKQFIAVNHKTGERIKVEATHIEYAKESGSIRVYADNILLLSVKEEHFSVYPLDIDLKPI